MDTYKKITTPILALDTKLKNLIKNEDPLTVYNFLKKLERYVSFRQEQMKYINDGDENRAKDYEEQADKMLHDIMAKYYDL